MVERLHNQKIPLKKNTEILPLEMEKIAYLFENGLDN